MEAKRKKLLYLLLKCYYYCFKYYYLKTIVLRMFWVRHFSYLNHSADKSKKKP